jgi:hypothetical protein
MLLVVAVAACSAKSEHVVAELDPEPVIRAPDPIAPLFERVLPGSDESPPLIGPGGMLEVGARRWTRDGRYLGRQVWAIDGQIWPLAVVGTTDRPLLVAIGWGGMESLADGPRTGEADRAWLLVAAPGAAKPIAMTPIDHELFDRGFTVSPSGTAIAAAEGAEIIVRALPSTAVIARSPIAPNAAHDEPPVACWIDDARIAWTEVDAAGARLRTLALATGNVTTARLAAAAQLICDPGGGAAAMVLPDRVAVIDLASAATLASVPLAPPAGDEPAVAVGQQGARLAIAAQHSLTIYHRDGAKLESLYTHVLPAAAPVRMQFSTDGTHLAVATTGLTVFGPPAEAHHAVAPRVAFELPAGFTARAAVAAGEHTAWDWAQLAPPPGMTSGSVLLVDAVEQEKLLADVTAIAIPHDELVGTPAPDATDEQLTAFAKTAMPQLFAQWAHAEIEPDRDAEFTLRVGRTKGIPWFETREVWRDGCEPYDGSTRVVIDRDAVFVIRALVPPAGSIKGWLEKFFDLPFGNRVQTARRRGPDSGPC